MTISVFDLFTIGIGPSSSHTVGPMRAANQFVVALRRRGHLDDLEAMRVDLFGSLAATGAGHGTMSAILLGLEGCQPETITTEHKERRLAEIAASGVTRIGGVIPVPLTERDIDLHPDIVLPTHPNGMTFTAAGPHGRVLATETYFSVGGGFIVTEQTSGNSGQHPCSVALPYVSAQELLDICDRLDVSISEAALRNETCCRTENEVRAALLHLRDVMVECEQRSIAREGLLPGGLRVRRRAKVWYDRLNAEDPTREAYRIGGDWVQYRSYPGIGTKQPRDVPVDVTTIAKVRLLDPHILSRTFTQQQQLKNFFSFAEILDIDRYRIDGELQDYIVGVREFSPKSLTGNQTDWINKHTVYTHGNGFVAAPANRVNAAARDAENISDSNSGYPIYAVSDIASLGSGRQVIPVEQPRVYYGEVIAQADPDYAIVGGAPGSAPREYDTDTSKYTYTGAGGVSIGNWFNRTVFATKVAQHKFLFSREIGSESKVLIHRDPKERVQRVAPWLTTDDNPYPVVVNGRIVWIVDAYTTLDTYPYAQRSSLEGPVTSPTGIVRQGKQVSYVRNSVKATVDAYDGTVTLFQFDRDDPVLRTWMRAFPGTVKSEDQIPDELRAHFRYPEDLFEVQRSLLAKYHVDEPREFFTTNAFWSVPSDPTNDANATQPPFYVLVGDQQSAQPSFRLASAMVGYNREFLSAYISAHSDPANYGKLTVLELPTDTLTQGPQQIQNSMISDTRVASERTLLERSNRIHYGNLLSLPIADGGVLYVEPLYTERISTSPSSSTFPQLSRVLVSVREPRTEGGVRVGYAPTLAESLDQVFGPGTGRVATAPGGDAASAPPPGAGGPAPPQAVPPPRTTQPPAAPPRGPDVPPATVAELRETLADLRAVLDRLEKAIDAAETPGG
ncbi:transmembrane protein [Mycobacterium tuberculosis]|nr:transmembrane protein [Mycobacterium tuberculosis]